MKVNDKVKVKKGLMQGRIGFITSEFMHKGKKMFVVKQKVFSQYTENGWDRFTTTVTEDEIEKVA